LQFAKAARLADGEVSTYEVIQAGRAADLARATEQVTTLQDEAQAARAAATAGTGTEEAAVAAENKASEAIKNLTGTQEAVKETEDALALRRVAAAQANRASIKAIDAAKKAGVFGKIPEVAAKPAKWLGPLATVGINAQYAGELVGGKRDGEDDTDVLERRLSALGWMMLGAEGLKGSPFDVPLKEVPDVFVKAGGKAAEAAGAVRDLVSSIADKTKPNMTLGEALNKALGKAPDFETRLQRAMQISPKQAEKMKASTKVASQDVQAVFNANPDIDSPKELANALRKDNQKAEMTLMQTSGLTRDTAEPVVPDAQKILEDRIDKFFADNKGQFSAEDAERAKKDVMNHFLQREEGGVDENGKPVYTYRAPNLFEAENVRVGLNDLVRPQYNTNAQPTTNAFKAAAFDAAACIRDMIDKSYDAHNVEGVKEFRAKEKAKIDVADALEAAQSVVDKQGEPGLWKALIKHYGVMPTITAISLGFHQPWGLATMIPYLAGEYRQQNLTNKLGNLRAAMDIAAKNPNAKATGVTVRPELAEPGTTPPNAKGQVGPPMAAPPAPPVTPAMPEVFEPPIRQDSSLHAKLASYLHKRVGAVTDDTHISYEDAEKEFLARYEDNLKNNVLPEKMKKEQDLFDKINEADAEENTARREFEAKAAAKAAKETEKAAKETPPPKAQAPESSSKEAGAQEQAPVTEPIQKTPQLNAETRAPFKTEPHQEFPEEWRDLFEAYGMSMPQVAYHELAHAEITHRNGFETGETLGQEHLEAKKVGAIARAGWNQSQFRNAETGDINKDAVFERLPDLLTQLYAGPVADELYFDIKMENNKGAAQDLKNIETMLDIAQIFDEGERAKYKDAAIDDVTKHLTRPGAHDIRLKYTQEREAGIPKELLMTAETSKKALAELDALGGQNEEGIRKVVGNNERTVSGFRGINEKGIARGEGEVARGNPPATAAQARTKAIESPLTQNLSYEAMKGMKEARESENLPINVKKDVLENPLAQRLAELKGTPENPLNAEVRAPKPISERLVDKFGTTEDPLAHGFILADGRRIDMGDRIHQGAFLEALPEEERNALLKGANTYERTNASMEQFLRDEGAIRVRPREWHNGKELNFEIPNTVTEAQLQAMRQSVGAQGHEGRIVVEKAGAITPRLRQSLIQPNADKSLLKGVATAKEFAHPSDVDNVVKELNAYPKENPLNAEIRVGPEEEGFAFGKNAEGTPDQQKGLKSGLDILAGKK